MLCIRMCYKIILWNVTFFAAENRGLYVFLQSVSIACYSDALSFLAMAEVSVRPSICLSITPCDSVIMMQARVM